MINRVIEFAMNKQIFGTENNCSLSKCPFDFHSLKCQRVGQTALV